jgi:hypothetical protein
MCVSDKAQPLLQEVPLAVCEALERLRSLGCWQAFSSQQLQKLDGSHYGGQVRVGVEQLTHECVLHNHVQHHIDAWASHC